MEAPKQWVSKSFMKERSKSEYVNPQEYCMGVTHPETSETITSYKKRMQIPALKLIWEEVMCKELGKISNGWKDTEARKQSNFYLTRKLR